MNKAQFIRKVREYAQLAQRSGRTYVQTVKHICMMHVVWVSANIPDLDAQEAALTAAAVVLNREYLEPLRQSEIAENGGAFISWARTE